MRRLSIFFNPGGTLEEIVEFLGEVVGHPFRKEHTELGPVFRTTALCIELLVFDDHGLEDDQGIAFTDFSSHLQLIPLRTGERIQRFEQMYQEPGHFLAANLASITNRPTILAENLQKIIASFES